MQVEHRERFRNLVSNCELTLVLTFGWAVRFEVCLLDGLSVTGPGRSSASYERVPMN